MNTPIANNGRIHGSFRDLRGFLFNHEGTLYRQINQTGAEDYAMLMRSELYKELVADGLLVAHEECGLDLQQTPDAHLVIRPRRIPFISYPCKWCFSALKDAALLTLDIQKRALRHGMWLRDCTGANVQFEGTRPTFIDTLSFGAYQPGALWLAYVQFLSHFLAPLALVAYRDVCMLNLLGVCFHGIPLDLATKLLPWHTRFRPGIAFHLHKQAKYQRQQLNEERCNIGARSNPAMPKAVLERLVKSLERTLQSLHLADPAPQTCGLPVGTESPKERSAIVSALLEKVQASSVWEFSHNEGPQAPAVATTSSCHVAFSPDPTEAERRYLACRGTPSNRTLPLHVDLTTPTPAMGWAYADRQSLVQRGPADTVVVTDLLPEWALNAHLPLEHIAGFLSKMATHLVIEFVPKEHPEPQRILRWREAEFPDYSEQGFLRAFGTAFEVVESRTIPGSESTVYLMRARAGRST